MLSYEAALRAIFQRTDYERGDRPPYPERVWRLGRMREFLEQLGNPQNAFRAVHIAGTKGKGSTTAMIESILRAAGYRTGMYTSPHLHTFRERIRLQGELIPEEAVAHWVERLLPILETRPEVTVFEIITALAMAYFAECQVDFGVFEVGMGGRLDATNVLTPLISVITSISLDHQAVLGNTLGAIAREKAGIIKPGTPVVSAPQQPEAMQVIQEVSAERKVPLTTVGQAWQWFYRGADAEGQRLDIYRAGRQETPEYADLNLPLLGAHQLENACVAVATIEGLRERGVAIDPQAVRQGLATVYWPGRLEILGRRPFVVVDGAHNVYSVQRLLESLPAYLACERLIVVFGVGTTHHPQDLLAQILPAAQVVYVTQSRHAKATPVAQLQALAGELGYGVQAGETVESTLRQAIDQAQAGDLVLVTGSLFVVAEAREAWFRWHELAPLPSDPPGVY